MTVDPAIRARRRRVGLLVLAGGLLFSGMIAFLVGRSLTSDRVRYYALFLENVKGMVIGSNVNFQGVPIGSVSDIRFQDGYTLVEMSVDPTRAVIQTGTRARLDRLLVTGQVTVELEGFDPRGAELAPGGYVEPIVGPMQQLTASIPETLARFDALLERGLDVMTRVETLLGEVTPLASELRSSLRGFGERANGRLDEVAPLIATAQEALARIDDSGRRLNRLLTEAEALIGASRRPWLEAVGGMREAFSELRMLARNLRNAPSTLLYGRAADERAIPDAPPAGPGR
jgi:phospholipid/cholesterol/gamma-HCH transport system substrate-binding protein